MAENKTILTFYDSNDTFEYKMELDGYKSKDLLRLVGMLELCKKQILNDIDELSEEWET